jgi:hypothetical protein
MRSTNKALVLGLAIAAVSVPAACRKSAETERREANEAETRSAHRIAEAQKKAIDERNDWVAVVRREQLDLRARLQDEIDDIDKKLMDLKVDFHGDTGYQLDPKAANAPKIQQLLDRRGRLEANVTLVEGSDETTWEQTKAAVERELGGRPRGRM